VNFQNNGTEAATLAGATALADAAMNGTVIYVAIGQSGTDNTWVF
jgi:hypothetical protein